MMSSYYDDAFHPTEGRVRRAFWIDDHFGGHEYGVQFDTDGPVFRPSEVGLDQAGAAIARLTAALEAAKARIKTLERMDSEAATYVESVICMKSNRFTGEPPYVGWKGLGLALTEDYEALASAETRIATAHNTGAREALEKAGKILAAGEDGQGYDWSKYRAVNAIRQLKDQYK